MFRVDRSQDSTGAWQSDKTDITNENPTFAVDFGTAEVGFLAFLATGPSFHLVPIGQPLPPKPTPEHKHGVRLKLLSKKSFGGLREFASSAKSVLGAIDALHCAYEAAPEAAAGKIPVVQLVGSTAITTKGPTGNVTSYSPALKIMTWTDRTEEMGPRTVLAPGATTRIDYAAASAAAAKTNGHAAPPAAVPLPATAEPPQTVQAPEPAGMPDNW
jgi:hypothetical protein